MGGMIAQRVALAAPARVLSLTSIMSSSGARHLPGPRSHVLRALLSRPKGHSEQAIVDHYIKLFKVIGSPGLPVGRAALRERILISTRRSFHSGRHVRQIAAVAADAAAPTSWRGSSRALLSCTARDDPLVPFACGHDTARRIRVARCRYRRAWGMTCRRVWCSACCNPWCRI
jgi:hypothetical protein